jgi:hypothetical protein
MKPLKFSAVSLLFASMFVLISATVFAQSSTKKVVDFKAPKGFLSADIPTDKNGLMMLNPKKPAGLFTASTPAGQKTDDYVAGLRNTFAAFFIHEKDAKFEWQESALTGGAANETGKLYTTTVKDEQVQVAVYTMKISETQDFIYGYFAKKGVSTKKDSADFIDSSGKGVKEFEVFRQSIRVEK